MAEQMNVEQVSQVEGEKEELPEGAQGQVFEGDQEHLAVAVDEPETVGEMKDTKPQDTGIEPTDTSPEEPQETENEMKDTECDEPLEMGVA